MAQLTLTIKDTVLTAATEAVAAMNGYTDTIPDPAFVPSEGQPTPPQIPNVSKNAFLKKQIKAWLRNQTIEHANRVALANVVVEAE